MIEDLKKEVIELKNKSIFSPNVDIISNEIWFKIIDNFQKDYNRYYQGKINSKKIKYFPGLLATFFYRISRELFLSDFEEEALEFSSLGFYFTSIEIYYSADIGESFKMNHGVGTVIGAKTKIGKNALFHQGVTLGEKNGGRAQLGDNVVVYPGATIVGGIFIGDNSIIGANVFVDKTYPQNSKIY